MGCTAGWLESVTMFPACMASVSSFMAVFFSNLLFIKIKASEINRGLFYNFFYGKPT
jgi:hypothetical protein